MNTAEITVLLQRISAGESAAHHALLERVYGELKVMAGHQLHREGAAPSLSATALVHEAWLRLNPGGDATKPWQNRRHFFAAAAEAMRRILVDQARRRQAQKRARHRVAEFDFGTIIAPECPAELDLIALDDALQALRVADAQSAEVLELRFFAGLPLTEIADMLQLSRATVVRELTFAKCWLKTQIEGATRHVTD